MRTALVSIAHLCIATILIGAFTLIGGLRLGIAPYFGDGLTWAPLKRPVLLSLFTLFGVMFRLIYDELDRAPGSRVRISTILRNCLARKGFWLAVAVSPVVILAFYPTIQAIRSDALVALMAYQNGFFFKSVIVAGEERARSRS